MLNLVTGRAGSGKTEYILNIIENRLESGIPMIYIVPEQISFETERKILKKFGADKALKIEVLSFTRLSEKIFREYGDIALERIDESGKSILMSRAIDSCAEHLSLFANKSSSTYLIDMLLGLVTEFKQGLISPEQVQEISLKVENNVLKQKLEEISKIYAAYEALICQCGADSLNDITLACKKIQGRNFFGDYTIFIDSFKSFTSQEYALIEKILEQSRDTFISLCIDKNDISGLFDTTKRTEKKIRALAKKHAVKIAVPVVLPENGGDMPRFRSKSLAALERKFFRYGTTGTDQCTLGENIEIYCAPTPYEECETVASLIRNLVDGSGYRYRDIAVITRDFEGYKSTLYYIFQKYNIPVFMDRRTPIENYPLIRFITTALEISCGYFTTDSIFKYAKTGFAGLDIEQIAKLENYSFLWDLKAHHWQSEFTRNPKGLDVKANEETDALLAQIEQLRIKLCTPLFGLRDAIQGARNAKDMTYALYKFSSDIGLFHSLREFSKRCGNEQSAGEQMRTWELFIGILDEITLLIGDEKISPKKFFELFKVMLASCDVGKIPQGLDQVLAGDAARIRPNSPRAVFIVGVNDGVFPAPAPKGALITERERSILLDKDFPLADGAEQKSIEERFLVYTSLTAPSEKLFLSYPRTGFSSSAKNKSEIIDEVLEIFHDIKVIDTDTLPQKFFVHSTASGFEQLAKGYTDKTDVSGALLDIFMQDDEYSHRISAIEQEIAHNPFKLSDTALARELFGKNMTISASRADTFYSCKFKYFCEYGLKAKERKKVKFDPMQRGTVIHYVMENALSRYSPEELEGMGYSGLHNLVKDLLSVYMVEQFGGWEDKSARFKYLFGRTVSTAARFLLRVAREFNQSEFSPIGYEVVIGDNGDIPCLELTASDGTTLKLQGKIDRVDAMHKDGKTYIRVVDYKTGSTTFELGDVKYGLKLQMLIYLSAISENGSGKFGENLEPAGILYISPKEENTKSRYEDLPVYSCSGLILDDEAVISGMENEKKPEFIPKRTKTNTNFATIEEFKILNKYIKKLLVEMSDKLHSGEIEVSPILEPKKGFGAACSCDYCAYLDVCHRDAENDFKIKKKESRDELYKIFEGEGE